jgi:ubiquinone/menaquinone biosynthesis C-methylase UbiE
MSIEERLEIERKKYEQTYSTPGYKMGRARKQHAVNIVKEWPLGSFIDVGCGRGEMLDEVKALGMSPVKGVEIVQALVDAREDVVYGHGASLPFSDREIDYVSMLDVVEHIPQEDIHEVFDELARVANKKILLCIANFPSVYKGLVLHVNIKPYKEWDKILKEQFKDWEVIWHPKRRNISETWEMRRC